jgi:hypothetical protein
MVSYLARRCECCSFDRLSSATAPRQFSLPGSSYLLTFQSTQIAFVFASETEGNEFYKKVANRSKYAAKSQAKEELKAEKAHAKASTPTKKKKGGKIDKSQISGPVRLSACGSCQMLTTPGCRHVQACGSYGV